MAKVYAIDGKVKGEADLPKVFQTPYRPDLIRKSVLCLNSALRQPHSPDPLSGLKTSGDYFGSRRRSYRQTINRGMTRLPRVKSGGGGLGRVVRIPQAKGGRKAHPPKNRDYTKNINKKEYILALNSAIAATSDPQIVSKRGHVFDKLDLPIIVEDKIESIKKTRDFLALAKSIGLSEELSSNRKKKMLLVVESDKGIRKAAQNVSGVDVATVNDLDVDLLAPGTHPGRLTMWSESALRRMG